MAVSSSAPESTHDQNDAWKFRNDEKQRVSDYLRQNPMGHFDHFRKVGKRAFMISAKLFEEVREELQERGALPALEGSRAHATIEAKLREKIRAELLDEMTQPAPSAKAQPAKPPEPAPVAALPPTVTQAPLHFVNESLSTQKDTPMAKPLLKIKELKPEQRTKLDTILHQHPDIEYADLMEKLGDFAIPKTIFWGVRYAISQGTYQFKGLDGAKTAAPVSNGPRSSSTPHPVVNGNGHVKLPFVNFTKIAPNQYDVIKRLDADTFDEADLKWIQTKGPSFLAQVLDGRMAFKIVRISEDDGSGNEKKQIEVRRIA